MKFDKKICEKMSGEIKVAMEQIAKSYGVKLEMGNGSFNSGEYTKKVSFKVISEDGYVENSKATFISLATFYGLKPEMFGQTFIDSSGNRLKIVGLSTRKSKNPVELVDVNSGKKYKAPASYVNAWFTKI